MPLSAPTKLSTVWNATGVNRNTIPVASQIGVTAGLASFTDGFPPLTMTPVASGGVPPFGQDFNGIFYAVTQALQWLQAGAGYPFDSTFATAVGGYPLGAIVQRSDGLGFWLNTSTNNTVNPETTGTGWVPLNSGSTSVAMASANVTLSQLQAGPDIILITGTLTANLNLVFPTWIKRWLVVNNATGAFSVTAKTASGSGVAIRTGSSAYVWGDGTNINYGAATIAQMQTQTGTSFTTAGTAPAFTLTPSPAITAYVTPLRFNVTFNAAGTTGSNTLNINGLGVLNLKQYNSSGSKVSAVVANGMNSDVVYDGTDLVIIDPLPSSSGLPRSYLAGLLLSNDGTNPNTTVDVAVGTARDSTNAQDITLSSQVNGILQASGSWTAGSNQNKLDTGAKAASTWYHVYAIRKDSDGSGDILFSLSASAPTMPSGYTYFRRIGTIRTDGSSNILTFSQLGDRFLWKSPVLDVNNVTWPTASRTLYALTVPTNLQVLAMTNITYSTITNVESLYVSSPDVTDLAPSLTAAPLAMMRAYAGASSTGIGQSYIETRTNSSGQIGVRSATGTTGGYIATLGWVDDRGRTA